MYQILLCITSTASTVMPVYPIAALMVKLGINELRTGPELGHVTA